MKTMVHGAFAFSNEALTQRWSWGRVMSRRSGGTWQRRGARARKLGAGQTKKNFQAGRGGNHSRPRRKPHPPVLMIQVVYYRGTVHFVPRSLPRLRASRSAGPGV